MGNSVTKKNSINLEGTPNQNNKNLQKMLNQPISEFIIFFYFLDWVGSVNGYFYLLILEYRGSVGQKKSKNLLTYYLNGP